MKESKAMFLDQHTHDFFREEAKKYQNDTGLFFKEAEWYLSNSFHVDVGLLIDYFEGRVPIDYENYRIIESRFMMHFFKTMDFKQLIEHSLFQLCMAIKMGFTKTGGVISFPEICRLEGMSKQQLHRSTYNILDNPPEKERKHKLPAVKLSRKSFVFLRDFHHWRATRIRRKK